MNNFDPRIIYAELRRFWWLPVIAVLAGLFTAAWLNSRQQTQYISTAKMVVAGKINLGMGAAYQENSEDFLGTQAAIIQGEVVAKRAQRLLADRGLISPKSAVDIRVKSIPGAAMVVVSSIGTDSAYTQPLLEATIQAFFAIRQEIRLQRSESAYTKVSIEVARVQQELERATQDLNDFQ